jgi:hypothetical protein
MTINSQPPDSGIQRTEPSPSSKDFADAFLAGIIIRLYADVIGSVPIGYEDETGFHLGVEFASN